ncbi:hypothetical protein PVK06_029174 [Gossypium arboreum]|uniref:Uncharacterized protein n=1 Tax=Gossypium arboreum TaxID=29729 RepID=A0ABR0P5Y5_GOSAR|nr:hypothetical protein PVK06_029174 [Gossypium arboreum]
MTDNEELELVSDIIDCSSRKWKTELICNTFNNEELVMRIFKFGKENSRESSLYIVPINYYRILY